MALISLFSSGKTAAALRAARFLFWRNGDRRAGQHDARPALLVLIAAFVWPASVGATTAAPQVGEITMLLGEVRQIGRDGATRSAVANGAVHIGDSIETAGGGHAHIRFVDGGVISIRPLSRLLVEDYRQSSTEVASGPKAGAIKFRLDEGVVRSITGRWGEAARERFRLNTPIAAIGIRGTDFVVQAAADSVRIAVHTGAVVAAPFGGGCNADGVGPCQGDAATLLSEDMGRVMLEVQRQLPPRILPRDGMLANMHRLQTPAQRDSGEDRENAIRATTPADKEPISETLAQNAIVGKLPEIQPSVTSTLVWGRFDRARQRAGDTLTVPRSEAAAGGRERVAENDYYALYRPAQADHGFEGASGNVTLGLASAQAHFLVGKTTLPATVQAGQLQLDFTARQFNTRLSLEAAPTGIVDVQTNGGITSDGRLVSGGVHTRVHGAVANNPLTAAYLFEHSTPQGMFTGIANWR